jgi:hypothetical protein
LFDGFADRILNFVAFASVDLRDEMFGNAVESTGSKRQKREQKQTIQS